MKFSTLSSLIVVGLTLVSALPEVSLRLPTVATLQNLTDLGFTLTTGKLSTAALDGIKNRHDEHRRDEQSAVEKRFRIGRNECVNGCNVGGGDGSKSRTSELQDFSRELRKNPTLTVPCYRGQYYTFRHKNIYVRIMVGTNGSPLLNVAFWMIADAIDVTNRWCNEAIGQVLGGDNWVYPGWIVDGDNRPLEMCVLGSNKCWSDPQGYCRL